ncbi:MAG: Jag N-terminal domain-containing protein, partial [Lachnospirales bacterium]
MKQIEQTGKTISEAVEAACVKLGVGLSEVEYKVLDEGSKGFLGIGARPAKVVVTCESLGDEAKEVVKEILKETAMPKVIKPVINAVEPKKEIKEEVKKATPVKEVKAVEVEEDEPVETKEESLSERASLTDEDKANIIKVAVDFITEVLGAINMEVEFDAKVVDNKQVVIEMKGDNMGAIIGKRGQTLDSLQYLTNLVVNKG